MLIIKMMQGLSSWLLSKCICLTIKMKILDIIILPGAGPLSSLFMFELSHLDGILDPSRYEIWSIFILVDSLIKIKDKNQQILKEAIQQFSNLCFNCIWGRRWC